MLHTRIEYPEEDKQNGGHRGSSSPFEEKPKKNKSLDQG